MGDKDVDAIGTEEAAKWDPIFTEQIKNWVGPVIKRYFRAEVRGLDAVPAAGGALLVSNHSGGMLTPDVLVVRDPAFYEPLRLRRSACLITLAHSALFVTGPLGDWLTPKAGVIEANRRRTPRRLWTAGAAGAGVSRRRLRLLPADAVGHGDRLQQDRTGYVRTAVASAGADRADRCPSAPRRCSCSSPEGTGWRNDWGCNGSGAEILPVTFGFPFGLSVLPAEPATADQDRHAGA